MPDTFTESSYNGAPIIKILTGINHKTGEEYWFSFGVAKAKAILEHIGEIENWVIKQEEKGGRRS